MSVNVLVLPFDSACPVTGILLRDQENVALDDTEDTHVKLNIPPYGITLSPELMVLAKK